MKPITITQWDKMNPKQRSWLVCKALGDRKASVFWCLYHPDGSMMGGSYQSRSFAFNVVDWAQQMVGERLNMTAAQWHKRYPNHEYKTVLRFSVCVVRCSVAFPLFAQYDHLSADLLAHLLSSGQTISLKHYKEAGYFMVGDSVRSSIGDSLAAATALTFLKSKNLIKE